MKKTRSQIRYSENGDDRITEQMTYPYAANTYVGWDFNNIRAADVDHTINDGYPYLREMPVSIEEDTVSVSSVSLVPTIRNYPNPFNPLMAQKPIQYDQVPTIRNYPNPFNPLMAQKPIQYDQVPTIRNYPNPFNPETTICFYLPQNSDKLDLMIYNLKGQRVGTLIRDTAFPKGESSIVWNGKDDQGRAVSSGVYSIG